MDKFVLFCGPTYAGKTTISDALVAQAVPITRISNDDLNDALFTNVDLLERIAAQSNLQKRMQEVVITARYGGIRDLNVLFAAAIPDSLVRMDIKYQLLGTYVTELAFQAEQTPFVEGHHINSIARSIAADVYRNNFRRYGVDFDELKKQIIYVDLDVETALHRFDHSDRPQILSRDNFEKAYTQWKQPPSVAEWSNTSVHIIDGAQPVQKSVDQVIVILNKNN